MKDSYRHKGLRKKLINELSQKGIKDLRILDALNKIPRHFFLDRAFEEMAYRDMPFQIGKNQTISQPFIVAYQTERLKIQPYDRVLEIGTGSGYQAALLSLLGAHVYTIERFEYLLSKAKTLLDHLKIKNIHFRLGDGFLGWEENAPYDKIILTAAPSEIPQKLLSQLKIGGTFISPQGEENNTQKMIEIVRTDEHQFHKTTLIDCQFVPMLNGIVTEP